MKRIICLILILLLILPGCSGKDQASFHYCRREFQYNSQDSVIVRESRDIADHADDLDFLIALYLLGPLETDYVCPFPAGTQLMGTYMEQDHLTVVLTETSTMTDLEYSLASACMALTCMELTQASTVTVTTESRSLTITPELLTIYDRGIPDQITGG